MTKRFEFGEINLTAGEAEGHPVPRPDTPFRIAILGDWSGRSVPGRAYSDLAHRQTIEVDRDNFDEVLSKLAPEIRLLMDDTTLNLQFSCLEDFHPDRIFEQATIFMRLRELRKLIADPGTFPQVAEELGLQATRPSQPTEKTERFAAPTVATAVSQIATGGLLDSMVEQTTAQRDSGARNRRSSDPLDAFVRKVTESHLVAAADPKQGEALAMIDRILTAQMRALLHVPAFQALEEAWRAAYFLVRRIETNTQLKLYFIDISREELESDINSSQELRDTGIYKLLVEQSVGTPGAEPWAVIAGNYDFDPAQEDAELFGRLAKITAAAGAPFLAAASPRLLGCVSLAKSPDPRAWTTPLEPDDAAAWAALRSLPVASWTGLALPRFLLRLPYGKKSDPIDSFDFEEMTHPPEHEDYLWGNPAFACTLLLAQSFSEDGWGMHLGSHRQIEGLPLHVYEQDGESELKPCAEALLTEEAAENILDCGLMPLESIKGQDALQLMRFQSIAKPAHTLRGRWFAH
jgi:type VI secretion system protein ImpC